MKKSEFILEVMREIEHIKINATEDEIQELDFSRLVVTSPSWCIYGQMTGSCASERAITLMPKKYDGVMGSTGGGFTSWIRHGKSAINTSRSGFTALEVYITFKKAKNEEIIQYLKGETHTLKL